MTLTITTTDTADSEKVVVVVVNEFASWFYWLIFHFQSSFSTSRPPYSLSVYSYQNLYLSAPMFKSVKRLPTLIC